MARHQLTHGQIFGELLKTFTDHAQALLAEATAIAYVETKKREFSGFINAGLGHEDEALVQRSEFSRIYAFVTKTPYKGQSAKGILKKPARPTAAGPGQQRCSHCGKVVSEKNMTSHMSLHMRKNLTCDFCGVSNLKDMEAKDHHTLSHTATFKCPKLSCNVVGSLAEMRRYHLPSCFQELYDKSHPLCQALLAGVDVLNL